MAGLREVLGTLERSLLVGKASILYRSDRLEEALATLQRVLELVGDRRSRRALSAKMTALRLLSQTAARLDDVALARSSLRDALRLWTELKLLTPSVRGEESMKEWERWARTYLAATARRLDGVAVIDP